MSETTAGGMEARGEAHYDEEGGLHGWCWDPGDPTARMMVELTLDGVVIRSVAASRFREDLRERGIGDGYHSFTVILPAAIRAENGAAHVAARVARTGKVFWQANALKLKIDDNIAAGLTKAGEQLQKLSAGWGRRVPDGQTVSIARELKMLAARLREKAALAR